MRCCLSVLPQEMEKLAVERHSRRVLTAAAPGKEKKAEADWAEGEAQRAETNTHRTQVQQAFRKILESSLPLQGS